MFLFLFFFFLSSLPRTDLLGSEDPSSTTRDKKEKKKLKMPWFSGRKKTEVESAPVEPAVAPPPPSTSNLDRDQAVEGSGQDPPAGLLSLVDLKNVSGGWLDWIADWPMRVCSQFNEKTGFSFPLSSWGLK